MLKIELIGADKMLDDLRKFRERAMPYAARDAVNSAAFEARRIWGDEIRRTFTTRNTFAAGAALRVDKARSLRSGDIRATLGSIMRGMPEQEFGATVTGRGPHKGIPGPVAAGQAAGGARTRPVRRSNLLGRIHISIKAKGATKRQRNAMVMAQAKKQGQRYVVLERPNGGRGIFLVGGGKRKITARLVWDVSRRSVRLSPKPTLGPTLRQVGSRMVEIQKAAVLKQLRFHKICGY